MYISEYQDELMNEIAKNVVILMKLPNDEQILISIVCAIIDTLALAHNKSSVEMLAIVTELVL